MNLNEILEADESTIWYVTTKNMGKMDSRTLRGIFFSICATVLVGVIPSYSDLGFIFLSIIIPFCFFKEVMLI